MPRPARGAVYSATAVEVSCPHCQETLPSPIGSFFWTMQELAAAITDRPTRTCDSCEEDFVLHQESKCHMPLGIFGVGVAAEPEHEADHE